MPFPPLKANIDRLESFSESHRIQRIPSAGSLLIRFQEDGHIGQGRVLFQKILNPNRLRELKSVFREVLGREAFEETDKIRLVISRRAVSRMQTRNELKKYGSSCN